MSTLGAFVVALGVLVFLFDLVRNLRPSLDSSAGNVWQAGTLEWLANSLHGMRSIPHVTSREPVWDQPGLEEDVEAGRYYLPGTATGRRETIVTSPIEAFPQYLLRLPGPGWPPFLAALFTAAFFMLLTAKLVTLALICGLLTVVMLLVWMWESDPDPLSPVDIGRLEVPTFATGSSSHSWWATIIVVMVAASLYLSYVFSYLYLWTVFPADWGFAESVRPIGDVLLSAALLVLGGICALASRTALDRESTPMFSLLLVAAIGMLSFSLSLEILSHWEAGTRPHSSGYGAMVFLASVLQAQLVVPLAVMGAFVLARRFTGRLDRVRRATFDNMALILHYAVAQGLVGLLLVHGFPRIAIAP